MSDIQTDTEDRPVRRIRLGRYVHATDPHGNAERGDLQRDARR